MYEEVDGYIICTICHNDCYACVCIYNDRDYDQPDDDASTAGPEPQWCGAEMYPPPDMICIDDEVDNAQQG